VEKGITRPQVVNRR